MSGPSDYIFDFRFDRLERIRERVSRQLEERARETAGMLQQSRNNARQRRLAASGFQAAQTEQRLDGLREAGRQAREAARRAAGQQSVTPDAQASDPGPQGPSAEAIAPETITPETTSEADTLQDEISAWRQTLEQDAAVQDFARQRYEQWIARAAALSADLSAASQLVEEARTLHEEAGELRAKFDTRNELLADVISAMKEVGFFVSDPVYEKADDPSGPVILRASCGQEQMTASIDLSQQVHSVWNGIETQRCKETFMAYVHKLGERGVDIAVSGEGVKPKPILKQKGVQDLPRGNPQRKAGR